MHITLSRLRATTTPSAIVALNQSRAYYVIRTVMIKLHETLNTSTLKTRHSRFTEGKTHQIQNKLHKEIKYTKGRGKKITNLVIYNAPALWNSLPEIIRHESNVKRFASNYDKFKRGDIKE